MHSHDTDSTQAVRRGRVHVRRCLVNQPIQQGQREPRSQFCASVNSKNQSCQAYHFKPDEMRTLRIMSWLKKDVYFLCVLVHLAGKLHVCLYTDQQISMIPLQPQHHQTQSGLAVHLLPISATTTEQSKLQQPTTEEDVQLS